MSSTRSYRWLFALLSVLTLAFLFTNVMEHSIGQEMPEDMIIFPEHGNLEVTGMVVLFDSEGGFITTIRDGNYPIIGIREGYFGIIFDGETVFVLQNAANLNPSELATSFTLIGLSIDTEDSGLEESEIDNLRGRMPTSWLVRNDSNARYEVTLSVTNGITKRCGPYGFGAASLTYRANNVTATIIDRETNEIVTSQTFEPELPTNCPRSYTFETVNGVTLNETIYRTPSMLEIGNWIIVTLRDLPGLPPISTPTPRPTQTSTPSSG